MNLVLNNTYEKLISLAIYYLNYHKCVNCELWQLNDQLCRQDPYECCLVLVTGHPYNFYETISLLLLLTLWKNSQLHYTIIWTFENKLNYSTKTCVIRWPFRFNQFGKKKFFLISILLFVIWFQEYFYFYTNTL